MRRWGMLLALAGMFWAGLWWLSRTPGMVAADLPAHTPDLANGERMFNAGGCASCHGEVVDGEPDHLMLGGGLSLESPAGTFLVPNISTHPEDGIGRWSEVDFLNAMQNGLSPEGRHYYPSFPYTSYVRMEIPDLLDLKAYLDSLPPVTGRPAGHELAWPYRFRWTLGLWKRLYLDAAPVVEVPTGNAQLARGRYLVEGPGHCGECHTPRNFAMAADRSRWLVGAPLPEGEGKASRLTPDAEGLGGWSESDLVYFLETGVDPDFDVVGGPMVSVQENLARLSAEDRAAIAAYLKALPVVIKNP